MSWTCASCEINCLSDLPYCPFCKHKRGEAPKPETIKVEGLAELTAAIKELTEELRRIDDPYCTLGGDWNNKNEL